MCVNSLAFSYSLSGWHYLTALLKEYTKNPRLKCQDSVLYRFHNCYQPVDVSDLVAHKHGIQFRPPVGVFPWGSFNLELSRKGGRPKDVRRTRQFGPTDRELVEWEFANTIYLYRKLRREGYRPWFHESGFVTGVFLQRNNGERRVVIVDGTHRCAILSFLGYDRVLMRYAPGYWRTLYEKDVDDWYYVKRSLCSRDDALAYFNAYFELNGRERAEKLGLLEGDR